MTWWIVDMRDKLAQPVTEDAQPNPPRWLKVWADSAYEAYQKLRSERLRLENCICFLCWEEKHDLCTGRLGDAGVCMCTCRPASLKRELTPSSPEEVVFEIASEKDKAGKQHFVIHRFNQRRLEYVFYDLDFRAEQEKAQGKKVRFVTNLDPDYSSET
ncbi:MAG TPA: hypothetical protein VNL14_16470 [Candidatus Acidoferrales bacterium]|nr:hypothetical protein [Candidatus Acidoferrales bacterium]